MKGVLFNTEQEANTYSQAKAVEMGCEGVTTLWWPIGKVGNKWAVYTGTGVNIPETTSNLYG